MIAFPGARTRFLAQTGWQSGTKYEMNERDKKVLLFGGIIAAILAVALVLSLPVELDYWYTVQSMVFAVVLFSLVVQGTTNAAIIQRFSTRPS